MGRRLALLVGLGMFVQSLGLAQSAAADAGQYVRTESGRVRCWVAIDQVGCEASGSGSLGFPQAPIGLPESQCKYAPCPGGVHWDIASVNASGNFQWQDGNIGVGSGNDLVLTYGQPYHLFGWTVLSNFDGTRIANDATGHGMFVSVENVYAF